MENLSNLLENLQKLKQEYKNKTINYSIPNIWIDSKLSPELITVNPFDYFQNVIDSIINKKYSSNGNVCYNLFIRATLSFDHKFNTNIKYLETPFFKNEGTFLKAIAFIPYLVSLGINKVHILPINSIGIDGKKGNLGSPYAIRNHYKLEDALGEDCLDLTIEEQYKAFIEACHICGIKVIQEFVFRTASIDSDLTLTNPKWFYWIKNSTKIVSSEQSTGYSSPKFSDKQLKKIKEQVEAKDFYNLTQPEEKYRNMFTKAPIKVARVDAKIIGLLEILSKPKKSNEVKIAPAFADWPPDDNQPAWDDVTYFKLYDNKDFNYIAYNTVRMYDEKLSIQKNKINKLWDYIAKILPFYIKEYNIDGAMIDMGHSLPIELLEDIIKLAKKEKEDFILWEENFNLTEESAKVYDAALGYSIFDSHLPDKLYQLLKRFENNDIPISFFGTGENHNTPRSMMRIDNKNYSILVYAIYRLLPIEHYLHSGFELLEKDPINTGLQFTEEQIAEYGVDKLALFSFKEFDWFSDNIIAKIAEINNAIGDDSYSKISAEEIGDDIFKITLNYSDSIKTMIYNHSQNTKEIDYNSEEIILQNNISIADSKITLNDYGFVLCV